VAAPQAEIGFLHAQLAVTTAWGGGIDLALTIGDRQALRLLSTSARLEAARAQDLGLVDWVCAPGQPLQAALTNFLQPYLARSRDVLVGIKAQSSANRRRRHAELAAAEEDHFVRTWTHADHWAAVAASKKGA
jgi:enoyl-CoA hydratase